MPDPNKDRIEAFWAAFQRGHALPGAGLAALQIELRLGGDRT